jgi:excisionase family DNA binding protein
MSVEAKNDVDAGDSVVAPVPEPATEGVVAAASARPTSAVDEVIDVQTVARLLHVGRNTVYALVARNQIPHRRLGKQIRFHQAAVMQWLGSWSSQGAKERQ